VAAVPDHPVPGVAPRGFDPVYTAGRPHTEWARVARCPGPADAPVPRLRPRLPDGLGGPVEILDADGWPHRVAADYLTLVESRPCVTVEVVQELRGRIRVKFAAGKETWVVPVPDIWQREPHPGDRAAVTWGSGI
jgi:hypothetical protein